ncbi:MAG: amino acid adenylation domain-containing protein [Proteobacteria bacterium]|nr:amino acid adenylation domain-containing protein [Pseudomonadota bacterium]
MLPLVELTETELAQVVNSVPGGAENIQDIYPLAPLQEGILFHHMMNQDGDAYITPILLSIKTRAHLDRFLFALQRVVDRHDILRTAILWQGLPRPVQVVHRHADLPVTEVELDPAKDTRAQLIARMELNKLHMDLTRAPLMEIEIARDPDSDAWYLFLKEHHLISDHVSLEIELAEIGAFLTEDNPDLPTPVSYREFVAFTQARMDRQRAEQFFKKRLADIDEPTAPFGLLDVYGDGSQTEELVESLPTDLCVEIRRQASNNNVSPAVLFHMAWASVVARCSDRQDIVFGTVMSGRLQAIQGVDRMLGLFINLLPLRLSLKDQSLADVLAQTEHELSQLVEFEQVPLADSQRCSRLPAGTPLFSAILNYRHEGDDEVANGVAWQGIETVYSPEDLSNYAFDMSIDDEGEGFSMVASIDRRVGAQRIMNYLRESIRSLVSALRDKPDAPFTSLEIMPHAEKQRLLYSFNDTRVPEFMEKTWPELFVEQAAKTPVAIAAQCNQRTLTYDDLNWRSSRLARELKKKAIGRGSIVALLDYRDLDLLMMIVGVLKAGAAYLPLDPTHPSQRWLDILGEGKPTLVILGNSFRLEERWIKRKWNKSDVVILEKLLPENELPDRESGDFDEKVTEMDRHYPDIDDLAYVIYTSGSTGKPKGVMIEHRGMINNIRSKFTPLSLSESDVIAQTASQCFDISVWQFLTPLLLGGKVVIIPDQLSRDPDALLGALAEYEVSIWEPVPSLMQAVLPLQRALPAMRWVLATGEALTAALVRRWFEQYPDIPLMNAYGPAECSDDVAFQPMYEPPQRVLIGRPTANAHLHVVDESLSLVPVGVVGELAVSGPVVGRGYLNLPEQTAALFRDNPYASYQLDRRLYLTGDLVKRLDDGRLEFIGRKDHQVKIRGFRIELTEIEKHLDEHPGIVQSVVTAAGKDNHEKRLVAYFAPALGDDSPNNNELESQALRAFLKRQLPDYMIPDVFVELKTMPLTNNGKIDRNALPEPDLNRLQRVQYVAPEGEVEQTLARIWQEILSIKQVGRLDHFFAAGGHSLLATQLLVRVRDAFDIDFSIVKIFDHPVLAEMADAVVSLQLENFEDHDLEELSLELDNLSEEELQALLEA